MHVLVVDDLEDMRRMLGAMLRRAGATEIGEAEDGEVALAYCEATPPDVVVMDIQMPNMRGTEATRAITQRHPDIAVFGFSAWMEEEATAMMEAGARAVFAKTDFAGLLDAINAVAPLGSPTEESTR